MESFTAWEKMKQKASKVSALRLHQSAQRTAENSAAIYRWGGSLCNLQAREAGGRAFCRRPRTFLSPVLRASVSFMAYSPSTKVLGYSQPSASSMLCFI